MTNVLTFLKARVKALVALAGVALLYLQVYQVSNPNHWVTVVIGILTVLGVHTAPNIDAPVATVTTPPVVPPVGPATPPQV